MSARPNQETRSTFWLNNRQNHLNSYYDYLRSLRVQVKLFRAEKLVSGLAGEKERWEASIINLEEGTQKLPGDCLVAAAFLSYAGPFATEYRDQLVTTVWMSEVRENKVQKINPFYAPFLSVRGDHPFYGIKGSKKHVQKKNGRVE
jgi:hypothetical protein